MTTATGSARSGRLPAWLPPLSVALAAAAVYANALWNGYALDDVFIIANNARAHDPSDLTSIWGLPYWPSYGEELGLYRPLAIFLYSIQWSVAGGAPWVFHLVNLLLHAGVSVLVYAFTLRLLPTLGGAHAAAPPDDDRLGIAALLAGLLFAVHPVHTEAVANLVGQAELVAAATMIGAVHLHATRPADRLSPGRFAAICALYLIGMLEKESAIVIPALLVAVDAAQGRWHWKLPALGRYLRRMAVPLVALAAIALGYLAIRVAVLGSIGGAHAAPNLPFLKGEHRVLIAFRAWPEYVRLLVFPADLSSDYSPAVILPVESLTPMAALGAVLLAATALLALLTPSFPIAGFAAAWFLITIMPVSNLLLPIGVVVAERLLYTPSVALSFVVAGLWRYGLPRASTGMRRLAAGAAVLALVAGAARTVIRNPDWKDTAAVWDAIVRDHPESYRSQMVNAARAFERGHRDLAREYLELAYRIWPDDAPMLNQLADFAIREGDYDRALELYERAREIAPFVTIYDVGIAIAHLGANRPEQALPPLDRAEQIDGRSKVSRMLRAQALERLGRYDEAAADWTAAIAASGANLWSFHALRARALARAGRPEQARAVADSVLATTEQPAARAEIERLIAAIDRGCYDAVASSAPAGAITGVTSSCDPFAEWGIVVPVQRSENATVLQNARPAASPSAGAVSGDSVASR